MAFKIWELIQAHMLAWSKKISDYFEQTHSKLLSITIRVRLCGMFVSVERATQYVFNGI